MKKIMPDLLSSPLFLSASADGAAQRLPFLTLTSWVRAAARCGFNIEPVFGDVGVQADLLHLESNTISLEAMRELIVRCVEHAQGASGGQMYFPFVLGDIFAFEYVPDVETFVATSSTLRDSFRVFEWVRLLINPLMSVSLHESGGQARLQVRFEVGERGALTRQYFLEAVFSTIVRFVRELLPPGLAQPHLAFAVAHPPSAQVDYAGHYRMPVRFGQIDDALVFDRRVLDVPLSGAFPMLHRQAEARVEQRIAQSAARPALAAHIEQIFFESPRLLGQGVEAVARRLQLHPRTLQRRLQDAGVCYTTLQAQTRFKLASQWLQDESVSIESISERLGFVDRRSFTQAFKRWAGQPPSAFRGKPRIG